MIKNKDNEFITRRQLNLAIETIITVIAKTIAEQREEIDNLKKQLKAGK